jgi:ABC-2 type transport system permease protein
MWTIFKYEYAAVVKKKSFIIGLLLTPAIMAAFILIPRLMADKKASETERVAVIDASGLSIGTHFSEALRTYKLPKTETDYYAATVFEVSPSDPGRFQVLVDSLNQMIGDEEMKYGMVIKDGNLEDSSVYLVTNNDDFVTINRFEREISALLSSQRLQKSNVNLPVDSVLSLTHSIDLSLRNTKGESISIESKYFGMMIFVMMMYIMILTYGMQVMRSVIEEKSTRIMEVLISSVSPFQLMMGKVLGLGAATFTSVAVWVVLGGGLYLVGGSMGVQMDNSIGVVAFNPVVVLAFVLFLVSGYVLYSTVYAVIGSLVTSEKEAQNFHFPIIISLLLPIFVGMRVMQEPNSMMAVVLSFIPIFTPTMMMMRVCFIAPGAVDSSGIILQVLLGFVLVVVTTMGTIWLSAKIFRVGVLMYGKRPTLAEVIKWIRY